MGGFYSKVGPRTPFFKFLQREKIDLSDLIENFDKSCCESDPGNYIPVYQYKMALFEYIALYFEIYTKYYDLDNWEQKSIRENLVSYVEEYYPWEDQIDDERPSFLLYNDEVFTGIDVVVWPHTSIIKPLNFKTE